MSIQLRVHADHGGMDLGGYRAGPLMIGSSHDCEVRIPSAWGIASEHLILHGRRDRWEVQAMGPTWLRRDDRVQLIEHREPIQDGDQLLLGTPSGPSLHLSLTADLARQAVEEATFRLGSVARLDDRVQGFEALIRRIRQRPFASVAAVVGFLGWLVGAAGTTGLLQVSKRAAATERALRVCEAAPLSSALPTTSELIAHLLSTPESPWFQLLEHDHSIALAVEESLIAASTLPSVPSIRATQIAPLIGVTPYAAIAATGLATGLPDDRCPTEPATPGPLVLERLGLPTDCKANAASLAAASPVPTGQAARDQLWAALQLAAQLEGDRIGTLPNGAVPSGRFVSTHPRGPDAAHRQLKRTARWIGSHIWAQCRDQSQVDRCALLRARLTPQR